MPSRAEASSGERVVAWFSHFSTAAKDRRWSESVSGWILYMDVPCVCVSVLTRCCCCDSDPCAVHVCRRGSQQAEQTPL